MIAIGNIEKIQGNIAKVVVEEYETTYDCLMMQPLTGEIKTDFPYSEGDQVVCFLQSGRNIILGCIYNDLDVRDSEAEFGKVLVKSNKYRIKAQEEIEESAGTIKINSNNVIFNSGTNEGIMKINPTVAKINVIEAQINALKTIFTSWVPIPADGGSALKTLVASWAGAPIAPTTKIELENTKVKH